MERGSIIGRLLSALGRGVKALGSRKGWPVPEPQMWYAAPDYLTMTARMCDNIAAIGEHYDYVARTIADWLGENPRNDEPSGQNGYTGRRIGPVFWGTGYNGACLQVSGAGSEKAVALRPYWDNISRLDIQATLWYGEDYECIALHCARKSKAVADAANHRRWEVEHKNRFGGGDTCYLGSRRSARYHRIYDKWRESDKAEEWRYAWRFEVELKEGKGAEYWPSRASALPSSDYWASIVVRQFADRGIAMPRLLPSAMAEEERIPRGETSNARRLRWLASQVAPSIRKLLRAGIPLAEIVQALSGSTEPADRIISESYSMLTERYLSDMIQEEG